MNILIIGMGEVGRHLATTLSHDGHRIRAVDLSEELLTMASEHADIQTLAGNGSALSVLREAGASRSDLVIAVTDKDEVNMLAALTAKHLGAKETVARVGDRSYYEEEGGVAHDVIGIDLLINPQMLAAMEIHRLIRSFGAIEAQNLADNRVEVVDLVVIEKTRFLGRQLRDISMPPGVLLVAIIRGGRLLIPHGGDHVELGDEIWIVGDIDIIPKMETMFGISQGRRAKRVMIVGGGEIGLEVARRLERDDLETVIIESDLQRCRLLSMELQDALILHGDATNRTLLQEEETGEVDAFLALSNQDEVNIMACLMAKRLGARRCLALIHKADYIPAAADVGLDVAVSPRRTAANHILSHVRPEQVSRVLPVQGGAGEILEIHVGERARVLGQTLMYVDFPKGALIASVVRDDEVRIPRGTDEILPGDVVVIFTTPAVREEVERLFRGR